MIRFLLGDLRLTVLQAGSLWLDGGAMFGVVPKPLWERERRSDDRNRIRLAMNLLLVEDGRRRILLDTGAGVGWSDKNREIFRLDARAPREFLAQAGVTPEQIDIVVNTHLHFDHAGGNTEIDGNGRRVAAFPNARYVIQRGEIESARNTNERTVAAYRAEDVEPLLEDGRVQQVDGNVDLTPYLTLRLAPGHTPHLQVPLVVTKERTVAFINDLVPTTSHVRYPYIMGYDLEPLATLASKKRFLPEAAREGWHLVFEHDTDTPLGVLHEEGGALRATAVAVTEV